MAPGQTIQITINVTDGNAAEAVQQVVAQLNAIGPAGESAGAEAGAGLDKVGEHALSAKENVRLLNDDLGLRIPRAMQAVIGQSELLTGAIGTIGPGLIALGAVDIFAHMGESVYNLYEKYISLDAAQDKFLEAQADAKDKDFINVRSLEDAQPRLEQAQNSMQNLKGLAEDMSHSGWSKIFEGVLSLDLPQIAEGAGEVAGASQAAHSSAHSAAQAQDVTLARNALFHQGMMEQIELEHAGDASLKRQEKITAELKKQLELDKERQAYLQVQASARGNMGETDSGAGERERLDETAKAKAHAEEIELQRQETDQIIQMQNEAVNAGLQGNALRAAQEQEEIEKITRKFQEGEISKRAAAAETTAAQQKFAAQELKLQEELDAQTRHLADEATQSGLKGIPLVEAELRSRLDQIQEEEDKASGGQPLTAGQANDYIQQRISAETVANGKITELRQGFNQAIAGLDDRLADHEMQGYAKIAADAQSSLKTLEDKERETYGSDQNAWQGYQDQKTKIMLAADREMEQLHAKTMEQITKEEEQTARLSLPEWQQAQMKIVDAFDDRVREIQEADRQQYAALDADMQQHADRADADRRAEIMVAQDADQKILAARQLMNAQMQKSDEQTRDKLASGLQSLFEHPEQFFEKRAMDTAFQMMANQMLRAFKSDGPTGGILQYLFGMGPEMSTSTNPLTDMESVLGLGGHKHGTAGMSSLTSSAPNPALLQFQTSTSTMDTASTTFGSAVTQFVSAVGTMGPGGGIPGLGGGGGFGSGGSTIGGAGYSGNPFPGSDESGMGSSSSSGAALSLSGGGSYTTAAGNTVVDASTLSGVGESSSLTGAALGTGSLAQGLNIAGGALTGGMSIYSAYENSNPVEGAVGGAMGGMEIGAAVGGPVGAAIGAVVGGLAGLVAGFLGDQGRGKAESLDVNTIQPALVKDMQDYEAGRSGYNTLASELNSLLVSSQNSTASMGSGARNYYSNNIAPEINAVLSTLQKQEIGGRSAVTLSAAQYHGGGWTGDFGDLATSETEGFIHAMANEFVVQPMAAQAHAPLLSAINAGNVSYSSSPQPRMPASSAGGMVLLNVQALDAKSFATWVKTGGGLSLMAGLNQAQRQYSGKGRG